MNRIGCLTARWFTAETAYSYHISNRLFMTHLLLLFYPARHLTGAGLFFLCAEGNEWKGAVDSHFCSHQRPSHGRHKHYSSVESLGEMCGSLGGWPTFAPLFGLLERAASCAAEHTACNVIPSDCRCEALQATTNEACADAAWMFCIMHAYVFSALTCIPKFILN